MTGPWTPEELAELTAAADADMAVKASDDPSLIGITLGRNDYGNAQRLALYEGRNLRYVNDASIWFKWCQTNWCEAQIGDRFRYAAETALRIVNEELRNLDDPDERERHLQWAHQSLSEQRLRSMVSVAAGLEALRIDSSQLDARPDLYNAANCTIELLTGDCHEHTRDDLLTHVCPTLYEPNAESQRLDEFLNRFLPDEKERNYTLQVLAVSALSQGNAARKLILLLGPTSTGKSTLMELVMKTLGRDYTAAVNPSVFRGSLDDKPRPDLLRALNTRLVVASEGSDRWDLHTDQIKRMTGGDAVPARGMRSNIIQETAASFVPIIVANLAPTIHGADDAIRRRLLALIMDTAVSQDEDDGLLRSQLVGDEQARKALLARFVAIYRECGGRVTLPMPARFAEKTMDLFASLDEVHEVMTWLKEDRTIIYDPNAPVSHCISMAVLYKCYSSWIAEFGSHQMKRDKLGRKQFTQRLVSLGFEIVRVNGSRLLGHRIGETRLANMAQL